MNVWENPEAATMCFACGVNNPIGLKIKFEFDVVDKLDVEQAS